MVITVITVISITYDSYLFPKNGIAAFRTESIIPKRLFFANNFQISILSSDFSYWRDIHIIKSSNNVTQIEMLSILCLTPLYLRDALTDWDETLRVYRVHPNLVQRHIFNFRSGSQTGNGLPRP